MDANENTVVAYLESARLALQSARYSIDNRKFEGVRPDVLQEIERYDAANQLISEAITSIDAALIRIKGEQGAK